MDARHFAAEHTLRNGTRVTIRAVRHDDRERIEEAFAKLDRESVYTRFFTYKKALSDTDLSTIDRLDFVNDVMLVATTRVEGEEIIIGSARYVVGSATDGKPEAEIAFTVAEDYQGLGIAGRLLGHLIDIARECGIGSFIADVLPHNKAMLAVFARSGLPIRQQREGNVVQLTLALAEAS